MREGGKTKIVGEDGNVREGGKIDMVGEGDDVGVGNFYFATKLIGGSCLGV